MMSKMHPRSIAIKELFVLELSPVIIHRLYHVQTFHVVAGWMDIFFFDSGFLEAYIIYIVR